MAETEQLEEYVQRCGFRWQDPPKPRRPGTGMKQGLYKRETEPLRQLYRLHERPGQWARIKRYANNSAAHVATKRVQEQAGEGFEFRRVGRELYGRRVPAEGGG